MKRTSTGVTVTLAFTGIDAANLRGAAKYQKLSMTELAREAVLSRVGELSHQAMQEQYHRNMERLRTEMRGTPLHRGRLNRNGM